MTWNSARPSPPARRAPQHRQPAFEPPPLYQSPAEPPQQMLSRSTVSAVYLAFNTLAHTVLTQECAHPGRPGEGNDAADAEIMAG